MPFGKACACHAEAASSGIVRALSGAPARGTPLPPTRGRPRSPRARVRRSCGPCRGPSRGAPRPPPHDARRARSVGVHAEPGDRGVAVEHLDVVGRHAQSVGDDLRPRRLVALPVRRRAVRTTTCRRDGTRSRRRPSHRRRSAVPEDLRGGEPAHLDVARGRCRAAFTSPRSRRAGCSFRNWSYSASSSARSNVGS